MIHLSCFLVLLPWASPLLAAYGSPVERTKGDPASPILRTTFRSSGEKNPDPTLRQVTLAGGHRQREAGWGDPGLRGGCTDHGSWPSRAPVSSVSHSSFCRFHAAALGFSGRACRSGKPFWPSYPFLPVYFYINQK